MNRHRRMGEDYGLWLRLAMLGPIGYIDEQLTEHRTHPESLMYQQTREGTIETREREVYEEFLAEYPELRSRAYVARRWPASSTRRATPACAGASGPTLAARCSVAALQPAQAQGLGRPRARGAARPRRPHGLSRRASLLRLDAERAGRRGLVAAFLVEDRARVAALGFLEREVRRGA